MIWLCLWTLRAPAACVIDIYVMLSFSSGCVGDMFYDVLFLMVQKQMEYFKTHKLDCPVPLWEAVWFLSEARTQLLIVSYKPPYNFLYLFFESPQTWYVHDLFLYENKAYKAVYMYDCVELNLSLYQWLLSLTVLFMYQMLHGQGIRTTCLKPYCDTQRTNRIQYQHLFYHWCFWWQEKSELMYNRIF